MDSLKWLEECVYSSAPFMATVVGGTHSSFMGHIWGFHYNSVWSHFLPENKTQGYDQLEIEDIIYEKKRE